jgi:Ser-Thr-rich glycosyl-phosphatidyl-inositol-anchored membrane family
MASMLLAPISVVLALLAIAHADVQFTSPAAGAVLPVGIPLTITWIESGITPLISELSSYQLYLCAGGNDPTTIMEMAEISTLGQFQSGSQVMASINPSIGASAPGNA